MSQTNTTTAGTGRTNAPTTGAPTQTTPMWRLSPAWAHYGDRLDDAMREAVESPGSRTMMKLAQGAAPSVWDYVMDMADVLERADA